METVEVMALISGRVEKEILLRNEYRAAENEILKSKINKPLRFNDSERIRSAKIGKQIGLKALREIACIVKPETILEWFRRLVAKKFDGSMFRKRVGRPKTISGRGKIQCRKKLDGLLKYYYRSAA